jgi:hypothetical protein
MISAAASPVFENVRVAPGGWKKGTESDVLYTGGIGACIGFAVYDIASKVGHIAHIYSTEGSQVSIMEPLINSVKLHSSDPANLIGWITGASSEARITNFLKLEWSLRSKAIARLGKLSFGSEQLEINWNNDESLLVSMSLDCGSGVYTPAKTSIVPSAA